MTPLALATCISGLTLALALTGRMVVVFLLDNLPPQPHVPTFRQGLTLARECLTLVAMLNFICFASLFPSVL